MMACCARECLWTAVHSRSEYSLQHKGGSIHDPWLTQEVTSTGTEDIFLLFRCESMGEENSLKARLKNMPDDRHEHGGPPLKWQHTYDESIMRA